ncbi:uncharacterized protein LOC113333294 isoform X1 [Papaver somniferum]|uniref:uncharacterized protein LOC113333294 isoform X1 n=1 Tax=Papaver somniferum TaxID=3469 RepID=UPI000E6F5D7F|nr:uncharacterized protein LOC113333294 isoform X1 [Papaver somniferum]
MSAKNPFQNFRNIFVILTRYRSSVNSPITYNRPDVPISKHRCGSDDQNQGLQLLKPDDYAVHTAESLTKITRKVDMDRTVQQLTPSDTTSVYRSWTLWTRWILGAMLTLILPFWKAKWQKLLRLEAEVEMAVEVVEHVAETVEKVAVVTEKLSMEMADKIPGDGELKKAVLFVERVSQEAEKDARLTEDILHKLDDLKEDVEKLIDPIFDGEKSKSTRSGKTY